MKKKHSYLEHFAVVPTSETWQQRFSKLMERYFGRLPLLEKTLFIKEPVKTLSELNISLTQLSLMKALCSIIAGAVVLFFITFSGLKISLILSVLISAIGLFIGWCLPELYINDRVKAKHFFIHNAVPNFLDQFHLLVSSPAYESFGQAIQYIAPTFPGYLGDELKNLSRLQPFLSEEEMLQQLEKVCDHPLITELSTTVRVSSQFGSSLRDKTAQLVQTAQIEREQRIKDLGNKMSGLLLGPLLLFHLPALLIVFLIPFVFILQKGL